MAEARTYTIIGNSAAALSAVKAIRRIGDHRPILLISSEKEAAYSPVLTTYYIGGQIKRSGLFLVDKEFYRRHRVKTMFGLRVEKVDPVKQALIMSDRSRVDYDRLLIASGASARKLKNIEPEAAGFVSTLRTIEDAERIRLARQKAREAVVTGAGLVSLQTIKAILSKELKITVVVGSGQVLSQQMDRESAVLIQRKTGSLGSGNPV